MVHGLMINCDTLQRTIIHVSNQCNPLITKRLLTNVGLSKQFPIMFICLKWHQSKSKPFFASNDHATLGMDGCMIQLLISLTNGYQRPTLWWANLWEKNNETPMRTHEHMGITWEIPHIKNKTFQDALQIHPSSTCPP